MIQLPPIPKFAKALCVVVLCAGLAAALIYHLTQQADINYQIGHRFFDKGQHERAIPYFEKSLSIDPNLLKCQKELGYCFLWTHRLKKAVEIFSKIVAAHPEDYKTKYSLAEAYSWGKQYDKAIALLQDIVEHTNSVKAQIFLAEIYMWNSEPLKAVSILQELVKQEPHNIQALMLMGQAYYYAGQSETASHVFEQVVAEKKKDPRLQTEALQLLAEAYVASGQDEKALDLYHFLISQDPNNVDARLGLGRLLTWRKRYPAAEGELLEVLKIDPKNLSAMKCLGDAYKYDRHFEEAIKTYQDAIALYPNEGSLYTLLGEVYIWQRNYDAAIECFQKAIQKGESGSSELFYGRALLYSGHPEEALKTVLDVVRRDPTNEQAELCLADTYAYSEQFEKAIPIYEALLKKTPNLELMNKLAEALSWARRYKECDALYDEMLQEHYDVKIARQKARVIGWSRHYRKAEAEYRKILAKQYDKAIELEMNAKIAYWDRRYEAATKLYNELLILEPDNVEARFDLSQIYSYRFMWEEAITEYHTILTYEPNHFRAKDGLLRVELVSEHMSFTSTWRSFKAFSITRSSDINKRQLLNEFKYPINMYTSFYFNLNAAKRWFVNYSHLVENEYIFKLYHITGPESWVSGYYGVIKYIPGELRRKGLLVAPAEPQFQYSHDRSSGQIVTPPPAPGKRRARSSPHHSSGQIVTSKPEKRRTHSSAHHSSGTILPPQNFSMAWKRKLHHTYFQYWGAGFGQFITDRLSLLFNYDKQRLENDAEVILRGIYSHNYLSRLEFNCLRDLVMGMDYTADFYSDNNRSTQAGFDLKYVISRDPKRLWVKYRYYWLNFKRLREIYWTPKRLSTNVATICWRDYVNRGEVFFGSQDVYYELQYEFSRDTTNVNQHRFRWEFNWAITKKFNFYVGGSVLRSNHHDVYKENEFLAGFKYYF